MDVRRDSQLVIFSPSTIFITFSYKSLEGFVFKLLQSSRWRKPEVTLDFCVWPLCAINWHLYPDWPHTAVKRGARALFPQKRSLNKVLNFRKFYLVMDLLRDSQLAICSLSTIFITFFYKVLQVFPSNSYEVRGSENRKWRWIFAF